MSSFEIRVRDLVRLERGRKPPLGEAEITMLWPTPL